MCLKCMDPFLFLLQPLPHPCCHGYNPATRVRQPCFRHLPGHHAAHAGPSTAAHQEPHSRVSDGIPGPPHKQDDGGIGGVQLEHLGENKC